jgi:hypothetical protein
MRQTKIIRLDHIRQFTNLATIQRTSPFKPTSFRHQAAMPSSGFKVVVVGGGPVGLAAAHALTRANIDFVVLESRPSIVIHNGASLVLSPMGLRALGQLGLFESLNKVSTPVNLVSRCDHNGKNIGDVHLFEFIKQK